MKQRIKIDQLEPAGYQAVLGLEKFVESTPLSRRHKDLIKIRASQINGCAFCSPGRSLSGPGYPLYHHH